MKMTGQTCIRETFAIGMEKPTFCISLHEAVVKEIEPPSEEIIIEDSSKEDLPTIGGSPVMLDGKEWLGKRLKRSRKDEDDDEGPPMFGHIKRARVEDVLEDLDDSVNLEGELQENAEHGACIGEGPSNPSVESYQVLWNEDLSKQF